MRVDPYVTDPGKLLRAVAALKMKRDEALAECTALADDRDELLTALGAVEWMRQEGIGHCCPWCFADLEIDGKHRPDCQRQAALAKVNRA